MKAILNALQHGVPAPGLMNTGWINPDLVPATAQGPGHLRGPLRESTSAGQQVAYYSAQREPREPHTAGHPSSYARRNAYGAAPRYAPHSETHFLRRLSRMITASILRALRIGPQALSGLLHNLEQKIAEVLRTAVQSASEKARQRAHDSAQRKAQKDALELAKRQEKLEALRLEQAHKQSHNQAHNQTMTAPIEANQAVGTASNLKDAANAANPTVSAKRLPPSNAPVFKEAVAKATVVNETRQADTVATPSKVQPSKVQPSKAQIQNRPLERAARPQCDAQNTTQNATQHLTTHERHTHHNGYVHSELGAQPAIHAGKEKQVLEVATTPATTPATNPAPAVGASTAVKKERKTKRAASGQPAPEQFTLLEFLEQPPANSDFERNPNRVTAPPLQAEHLQAQPAPAPLKATLTAPLTAPAPAPATPKPLHEASQIRKPFLGKKRGESAFEIGELVTVVVRGAIRNTASYGMVVALPNGETGVVPGSKVQRSEKMSERVRYHAGDQVLAKVISHTHGLTLSIKDAPLPSG